MAKNLVLPNPPDGITYPGMTTISLKVPESLLREIEQAAAARGLPKSAVIRDSLERTLRRDRRAKSKVSCLDLAGDLVGHFDGPPDLSTNKNYLTEAIETQYERGQEKHPR
jgi:Arc/MetJ-type ribon-helix-helix transcriptional regulator